MRAGSVFVEPAGVKRVGAQAAQEGGPLRRQATLGGHRAASSARFASGSTGDASLASSPDAISATRRMRAASSRGSRSSR